MTAVLRVARIGTAIVLTAVAVCVLPVVLAVEVTLAMFGVAAAVVLLS